MSDTYLTPKELAGRLGRPEKTLERWRLTGIGPEWVRMGRRVVYPIDAVARWLQSNTFQHRAAEIAQREAAA